MNEGWNPESLRGMHLGSCVIEGLLGAGGMGAVYLARQERPRRQVAVKVLRPRLTEDAREWQIFLARFRREADATAALDHANIVPIYESGEEGSLAYLVMPYLPNGSLATLLEREGVLPLARVIPYVEQLAAALDYAHAHGIVHRDVKPSNVLLHPDGRVLLADFGIARSIRQHEPLIRRASSAAYPANASDGGLTIAGATMGTPEYMAPEQVRGAAVTGTTDIYALGILTYVMLTGNSPFAGGDIPTVLNRQLVDPPLPVRTLHPEIPARVEEVIFWALAKDPAGRPANAGEFAQALRSASRGRTLGALAARALPAAAASINTAFIPTASRPSGVATARSSAFAAQQGDAGMPTSDSATVYDTSGRLVQPVPQWPGNARATATSAGGPPISWPRLGALLAAAVVGIIIIALIVNALAQGSQLTGNNPGQGNNPIGHVTPSPTVTPQPTATPNLNVLVAAPTSISLGCKGAKRQAHITILNNGQNSVQWMVQEGTTSGISVSPNSGQLDSGESDTITVTNQSFALDHHGTISFVPNSDGTDGASGAGTPATVHYTTQACGGGGG